MSYSVEKNYAVCLSRDVQFSEYPTAQNKILCRILKHEVEFRSYRKAHYNNKNMCSKSPLVAEFPGYPFRAAYNSVQYPNVFSICCSIGILPCRMKFHVGFQGHRAVDGVRHIGYPTKSYAVSHHM